MEINDYEIYELGNLDLLSGKTLLSAKLAYKTYGSLNSKKNNVVVLPTFYTGTHKRNEGFFGEGRAIDPNKYFIVSINMFGNGLSSSPSNAEPTQSGANFPLITIWDNVASQKKLLFLVRKNKTIIEKPTEASPETKEQLEEHAFDT